jgi:hypothetical protein
MPHGPGVGVIIGVCDEVSDKKRGLLTRNASVRECRNAIAHTQVLTANG